jgi:hypothetical protein
MGMSVLVAALVASVMAETLPTSQSARADVLSNILPNTRADVPRHATEEGSLHGSSKLLAQFSKMFNDPSNWWTRQKHKFWRGLKLGISPFIWASAAVVSGGTMVAEFIGSAMVAQVWQEASDVSAPKSSRTSGTTEVTEERAQSSYQSIAGGAEPLFIVAVAIVMVCSLSFFLRKSWKKSRSNSILSGIWSDNYVRSVLFCLAKTPLPLPA